MQIIPVEIPFCNGLMVFRLNANGFNVFCSVYLCACHRRVTFWYI